MILGAAISVALLLAAIAAIVMVLKPGRYLTLVVLQGLFIRYLQIREHGNDVHIHYDKNINNKLRWVV
jgi:hypothetical protein